MLSWLDEPNTPALVTLYLDGVDSTGHHEGPDSPAMDRAIAEIDRVLGRLVDELRRRRRLDRVNLVVVSDHGMAALAPERTVYLDELVPLAGLDVVPLGIVSGITIGPGAAPDVEGVLLSPHPHLQCWRKDEVPARFHYGHNARVAPIVCLAETGWQVTTHERAAQAQHVLRGEHGFDPADPMMRAIFIARGPAFRRGVVVPAFDNVDLYGLLTRLVGIRPEPNDGHPETIGPMLQSPR